MFPYVAAPSFAIGPITIHGFGAMVSLAVVTGTLICSRRATRLGLEEGRAFDLVIATIAIGFVGSHLFSVIAYSPELLLERPSELLRIWGSMSSTGGIAAGLLGAWWMMRRAEMSAEHRAIFLDSIGYAFPFAWIFGRAGCALAHDHLGIATTSIFAVAFPTGPRLDMGLLEMLATIPIAALFFVLGRKPRPAGFFPALFLVLYGPLRAFLDIFRIEDARYLGITPAQYAAVAATIGGALWLRSLRH